MCITYSRRQSRDHNPPVLEANPVCQLCLTLPKYTVNNVRYSGITKRAVIPPRARPVFPLHLVSRLVLSVASYGDSQCLLTGSEPAATAEIFAPKLPRDSTAPVQSNHGQRRQCHCGAHTLRQDRILRDQSQRSPCAALLCLLCTNSHLKMKLPSQG